MRIFFPFLFIFPGKTSLWRDLEQSDLLTSGDSLVIPSGLNYGSADRSEDLKMLEVTLPEMFQTD